MEFGTLDGILGCVAAGLGQTLMPERVVRESRFGDNIVTEHIDPQFSRVPTVLVRYAHAEELMMLNVLRRAVAERVAAEHADAVA
jgi:DNA-binding transcriptional LysR family regulator